MIESKIKEVRALEALVRSIKVAEESLQALSHNYKCLLSYSNILGVEYLKKENEAFKSSIKDKDLFIERYRREYDNLFLTKENYFDEIQILKRKLEVALNAMKHYLEVQKFLAEPNEDNSASSADFKEALKEIEAMNG